MKPTFILGIFGTVLVTGVVMLSLSSDQGAEPETSGDPAPAKLSNRPEQAAHGSHRDSRSPNSTGALSLRSSGDPEKTAEERLHSLMTPQQRVQLAEMKQKARAHHGGKTPAGRTSNSPANVRALAQLREDMRTAIAADPDGWMDTYASLNRDYLHNRSPRYAGGGGVVSPGQPDTGGGSQTPDPGGEPTTPTTPDPGPTDPNDGLPPVPDNYIELANKYRYEQKDALPRGHGRNSLFTGRSTPSKGGGE